MNTFKIGTRLSFAFGLIVALLLALAAASFYTLSTSKLGFDTVVNKNNVKMELSNQMLLDLNVAARSSRNYILFTDEAMRRELKRRMTTASEHFAANLGKIEGLLVTSQAVNILKEIKVSGPETMRLQQQVVNMVDAGEVQQATDFLISSVQKQQDDSFLKINEMIALQDKQNGEQVQGFEATYAQSVTWLSGLTLFAVLSASILAVTIQRSITRPLRAAVEFTQLVAAGDLSREIEAQGKDEVSELLIALKTMVANLASIVDKVRSGTETISTGSQQISAGNQDLSARTEEQASSLEETASSMEELTSTVKQNADNARQASTLAVSASCIAARGGEVVADVVTTMGAINDSSQKIVSIIGVIDSIAFQTNILALNAAVEAARAGEQGRGFAVVASEVRNLAQRSAAAAKEIKDLISASVDKVSQGTKLVHQAGDTMVEVVESIRRVSDLVADISSASQEQNAGIAQINDAITQMDQVTQQNAALVEEAASAAEAMHDQAKLLAAQVSVFKIPEPVVRTAGSFGRSTAGPSRPLLSYHAG